MNYFNAVSCVILLLVYHCRVKMPNRSQTQTHKYIWPVKNYAFSEEKTFDEIINHLKELEIHDMTHTLYIQLSNQSYVHPVD